MTLEKERAAPLTQVSAAQALLGSTPKGPERETAKAIRRQRPDEVEVLRRRPANGGGAP